MNPDPTADLPFGVRGPLLYRAYDEVGELLYVGATRDNLRTRLRDHRVSQWWWPEVAAVSFQPVPLDRLRDAESQVIASETPRYNVKPGGYASAKPPTPPPAPPRVIPQLVRGPREGLRDFFRREVRATGESNPVEIERRMHYKLREHYIRLQMAREKARRAA